jgi:glycosyltransferase involved in cell wall biosynthesis
MSKQLDIVALEPFFGGARRSMLETLIRCSRHRWTLLKLPPRRIERRLAVAAHWFAEQLTRHWVGPVDLLFCSEALNLADLYRLVPDLAATPSVVYFHSNQLPDPDAKSPDPALDFANLNTAAAASEIWFNSKYHVRAFLAGVSALIAANDELAAQNPLPGITAKLRYIPPPVDMSLFRRLHEEEPIGRDKRTIFFETRDANINLFNQALLIMQRRGDKVKLLTVGPVAHLSSEFARQTISEADIPGQVQALMQSTAFVSTRIAAAFDEHAVKSLMIGCRPVLPRTGVYPELLPQPMHGFCLYDVDPESLASRMQDAIYLPPPPVSPDLERILHQYDGISACKVIDERLEEIAVSKS